MSRTWKQHMADEKKLKGFQKGNSGRPKDPIELHLIKRMTKGEFEVLMQKLIHLTPDELNDYKGTVLEMAMVSIMKKSIDQGDQWRLQFFIERLFGKVSDKLEVTEKVGLADKLDRFKKRGT